jgi:hypothetical protein
MLNLDKCVFRISAGKLLDLLVSHRGIEANPEKIKAIEEMWLPARIKDVQKLMGCLTRSTGLSLHWQSRLSHSSSCYGSLDPLSGLRKQMRHSRS